MNELKTFNEVYDAVYNWHIKNMKDEFIENGKQCVQRRPYQNLDSGLMAMMNMVAILTATDI